MCKVVDHWPCAAEVLGSVSGTTKESVNFFVSEPYPTSFSIALAYSGPCVHVHATTLTTIVLAISSPCAQVCASTVPPLLLLWRACVCVCAIIDSIIAYIFCLGATPASALYLGIYYLWIISGGAGVPYGVLEIEPMLGQS